jgi:hypothetical protein
MKTTFIKALLSALILSGMGVNVHAGAQDTVPGGQQVMTAFPELSGNTKLRAVKEKDTEIHLLAAAPPLSSMWVYAVGSTNCGWESTAGLSTTACNHGGPELRAAVLEIGYGSNRVAWMNGSVLPSSAMYASTPVCVTNGYYSWPCTAGQTVYGFLNEYTLDGRDNGLFRYQDTSTNSPWNTLSVQISIL